MDQLKQRKSEEAKKHIADAEKRFLKLPDFIFPELNSNLFALKFENVLV